MFIGLVSFACSTTQYRYVPAEHQVQRNKTEAIYSDPLGPQSGSVRIKYMGMVNVKPPGQSDEVSALHLRMSASNQSSAPWIANAGDQSVSFPNQGRVQAVTVKDTVSQITVQPGELGALDLYFPLPKLESSAKNLPEFNFNWAITSGNQTISEATPFDRQPIPDYYPYYNDYYAWNGWGWGPGPWWYW